MKKELPDWVICHKNRKDAKKVKINEEWIDAEVPKKTQEIINRIFIQNNQNSKPVT